MKEKKEKLGPGSYMMLVGGIIMIACIVVAIIQGILVSFVPHKYLPAILTNYNNGEPNLFPMLTFLFLIGGLIYFWSIFQREFDKEKDDPYMKLWEDMVKRKYGGDKDDD